MFISMRAIAETCAQKSTASILRHNHEFRLVA